MTVFSWATNRSNGSFLLATVFLYRLGKAVLADETTARRAAFLFAIAPSSVFMSALYSERCALLSIVRVE